MYIKKMTFPTKIDLLAELVLDKIRENFNNGTLISGFRNEFPEDFIEFLKQKGYHAENGEFIDYSDNSDGTEIRKAYDFDEYRDSVKYRAIIDLTK